MNNLKMLVKEKKIKHLITIALLLLSASLVFPENLRNIPLFILVLVILLSIFLPNKNSLRTASLKKTTIVNSLFFIMMLISMTYSNDTDYAIKRVTAMLGLFIIPISFYMVSLKSDFTFKDLKHKVYLIFFIASVVFFVGILIQNYYYGFIDNSIFTHYPERINSKYDKYSMHPLYASMYVCASLLFGIRIYSKLKKRSNKILFLTTLFFLFVILILLARKGIILFTVIAFSVYLIRNLSQKKVILSVLFLIILTIILISTSHLRVRYIELIDSIINSNGLTIAGSTTIRLNIYKLTANAISENLFFGYGIGDTKAILKLYYDIRPEIFKGKYYNTHNQFLSSWLSAGVLGFASLLGMMIYNLKLAIKSKDFIYISIILMFFFMLLIENILERQTGILLFSFFINYFAFSSAQEKSRC